MNSRFARVVVVPSAAALIAAAGIAMSSTTVQAAQDRASVSVFHAIPSGLGVDVVDVYADGARIINNLRSGQLTNIKVRPGTYDIEIFMDGERPEQDDAVLTANDVTFLAGYCSTLTANLDATGQPTTEVFANCTSRNPVGTGRVTVRHIAAAPAVDVLADGRVLFGNIANGGSATERVDAGPYGVAVALADSDAVVLGPTNVAIDRPFNTIVYAWGSADAGTLAVKVQRVPVIR